MAIVTILGFLILGCQHLTEQSFGLTDFGFGAADPHTLIADPRLEGGSIAGMTVLANLPQLILSLIYFSYNGLFTAMLTGYEWVSYAHKRKGLRVSRRPTGSQRSTYFLQLPYRFSIPLGLLSVALHWVVSQSIFVVAVDLYDPYARIHPADMNQRRCGYSPIAILTALIMAVCMLLAAVGFGYLPYRRGMPLAGSYSRAISAACHPSKTDDSCSDVPCWEQKLRWGVCETGEDGVGLCAFSSEDVEPLVKGQLYR